MTGSDSHMTQAEAEPKADPKADSGADPGAEEEVTVENAAPASRFLPFVEDPEYGDFSDEARAERLQKNLTALRRIEPGLADLLEKYEPSAELVFDDDGAPNIQMGVKKLYEVPVREYNEFRYESFWHNPDRMILEAMQPNRMDKYNAPAMHNMIKRIHDEGIDLYATPETRRSYSVIFLGIGLGLHLERFITETQCHCPIIVEPNLEFLRHSLETTDWWRMQESLEEKGGRFYFALGSSPDNVDKKVRAIIRGTSLCGFDGLCICAHYELPFLLNLRQILLKKAAYILDGLGFVEDEFYMLRNAYSNLLGRNPRNRGGEEKPSAQPEADSARISQRTGVYKQPCPLFLVGSGPSLDSQIEVIRANQGKAVIFSCGSAIRPLLAAGIKPDLHLEIERNVEIMPLIQHTAKEFDLEQITLVASATVDPRMQAYFGRTVFYFRAALSCTPLFAPNNECQPQGCGPTVVNAGLGFSQDVGFREIYFFGVDLGTKIADVRHAADSWHGTLDGFENQKAYNIPAPGNFGGTVFAPKDLIWTREELETGIRMWRSGRFYYNCSDGQRIKGAKAVSPHAVNLPDIAAPGGKEEILETLWGTFPAYTRQILDKIWDLDVIKDELDEYMDDLIAVVEKYPELEDRRYLGALQKALMAHENPHRTAFSHIFRGTLMMVLLGAEYYLNRIRGRENFEKARDIVREELINLINDVRREFYEDLEGLTAEGPLMHYVNRKDMGVTNEKEIPESLPVPERLQALFDAQPWAEDMKVFYAEQKKKRDGLAAERAAKDAADGAAA
ncbi:MAG: motility associated factor glycosyltransferase family protein [Rhodospirillales bacterium]